MEMQCSTSLRNRNLFTRLGLAFLLFCSFGQSAYADWSNIGLTGERVNTLEETGGGILFAGTDNGIFKIVSTPQYIDDIINNDSSPSWIESNNGMGAIKVQDIVSYYSEDGASPITLIYSATASNGIFKSDDEGATWVAINTGLLDLRVNEMVIDPITPDTLYAGTASGVFKSIDAGTSWFTSNNGLPANASVLALAIDPVTPSTLYSGFYASNYHNNDAIYKTIDGGANWFSFEISCSNPYCSPQQVSAIFINPARPTDVYYNVRWDEDPVLSSYVAGYPAALTGGAPFFQDPYISGSPGDSVILADPLHPRIIYEGHSNHTNGYDEGTYGGNILKFGQDGWVGVNTGIYYRAGLTDYDIHDLTFGALSSTNDYHFLYAGTSDGVYASNEFVVDNPISDAISNPPQKYNRPLSTYFVSDSVCVSGINVPVPVGAYESYGGQDPEALEMYPQLIIEFFSPPDIIVTSGEYSVNGGPFTSEQDTVLNGDCIRLRVMSSTNNGATTVSEVGIAQTAVTFSVRTVSDGTPDQFSFTDQDNAITNTLVYSNTITITGIQGTGVGMYITGGEYNKTGGPFPKDTDGTYISTSGIIYGEETITLRTTSSSNFNTTVDVVLTIGGISDTFTVTTEADTDGDGIGNTTDINDDNDGYDDTVDNCSLTANDQLDTDNDGYGNACDSDFNNDGIVNSLDIGLLKTDFFKTGGQQADVNGDNIVNSLDLGLFKQLFFTQPGPSGLVP